MGWWGGGGGGGGGGRGGEKLGIKPKLSFSQGLGLAELCKICWSSSVIDIVADFLYISLVAIIFRNPVQSKTLKCRWINLCSG